MSPARTLTKLAVVAPCFNEEAGLPEFVRRVKATVASLGVPVELVLVNDGSRDRTLAVALELATRDPAIRVVNLLRNFGHQAAVTAGLDVADGDAVVLIDSDLQDPPELIPAMVEAWRAGADVAYGQRRTRAGETPFKLFTAKLFYRLLRRMTKSDIPADTGDFRLMDRRVVEVLRTMRERHRFIRGMVSWVGGRQVAVPYDRQPRFAGETKYPLRKMLSFAVDAITSFSVVPLRLVTWLALAVIGLTLVAALVVVAVKLANPNYFIPGYPSIIITIVFFGGVQLLALGIIGEYLGRMYESTKARPIYIIEQVYHADAGRLSAAPPAPRAPATTAPL
ncbi:MAG TPA: glycosyltransferase family 2 protein [Opitutaceae bacterium]|nr:glycosyltransferase family 2 protein [Opitutaceae bacterium]